MPLYEYECDACGRRFELIQKFSDPAPDACRHCGKGPVHRLLSSPAIQFKGTGWYITDYARKGTTEATTPAGKTDAKSDSKPDSSGKSESSGDSGTKTDTAKSATTKSDTAKSDSGSSGSKSKE